MRSNMVLVERRRTVTVQGQFGYHVPDNKVKEINSRGDEDDDEDTISLKDESPNHKFEKRSKPSNKSSALSGASGVVKFSASMANYLYQFVPRANNDGPTFKLHYRTTAALLFICSIYVNSEDFIGNNISCFLLSGSQNYKVIGPGDLAALNNYCWVSSTYSYVGPFHGKKGVHFAYQGARDKIPDMTKKYNAYYQWVGLFLFLQGVMFCVPHFIWNVLEDDKMDQITVGLREPTLSVAEKKDQLRAMVKYYLETFNMHNTYVIKYFICEILSILHIVGQIYFTDRFLGGSFIHYGFEVFDWLLSDDENRTDPLVKVFPRITKCDFHQYGPSGTIVKSDAMCLLPQNILSEKVFVMLWLWLLILAFVSLVYLIYLVALVSLMPLRKGLIERNSKHKYKSDRLDILLREAQTGDWFMLYLISTNLNSVMFKAFISDLTRKLKPAIK